MGLATDGVKVESILVDIGKWIDQLNGGPLDRGDRMALRAFLQRTQGFLAYANRENIRLARDSNRSFASLSEARAGTIVL